MQFRILGPLEVTDDDDRPVPVAGAGQRALLAVLLLHANEVVSSDRLIDQLWDAEPPGSGVAALRVRVSQLRKALGLAGDRLETTPAGYLLRVANGELDLDRFTRLLEEADGAEPAVAAERLREALALWRGAPLADFAYAGFAQQAIARLEELRLAAIERRIEADLALGRHSELVGELRALIDEHPLRERPRGQLMLALYRSGRQAEALDVYRQTRSLLVDELGLEPSPALQELEQAILRQDPTLAATEGARASQRSILVAPRSESGLDALLPLAEPPAARSAREVILAMVVAEAGDLAGASAVLGQTREALIKRGLAARVGTFTSADPTADVLRTAREQDVDLLLLEAPAPPSLLHDTSLQAVLARLPCDAAFLISRGEAPGTGPVVVPFGAAEHDWAALELGAWLAVAHDAPLRLAGVEVDLKEGGRDASRLLAHASLVVQKVAGVAAEPLLVGRGAEGLVDAADDARLLVLGLPEKWRQAGSESARLAAASRTKTPTLLVQKGLRPSGIAPEESLTRFTWTLAGTSGYG